MAQTGAVAGFEPSTDGWHFGNDFSGPAITVPIPGLGKIGLGNASHGVCGGMVFAARDYLEDGRPIPGDTTPPAQGTPLFEFVTGRLLDSFDIPRGVLKYLTWMATPDHDGHTWFGTDNGVQSLTSKHEWPAIKANHVVLAHGYDLADTGDLTIRLYDPNSPDADLVTMTMNVRTPAQPAWITHNINISRPVRGFMALRYSRHDPPA